MKLSNLMLIKAVIVFVFGAGFLIMPASLMSYYGMNLDPGGAAIAQLLGASFVLLGIVLSLARNAPAGEVTLRALVFAIFIGDLIGFIVTLLAQVSGAMNSLGWSTVVIYLFLTLGFGYFQFTKSAAS